MIKFVGREKEEAELNKYLDLINEGKGGIVLISGEPGIGKTSFSEETVKRRGLVTYSIRANEECKIPYSLFTNVFRNCLRKNGSDINCGPYTKYLSAILPEFGEIPGQIDTETLKQAIISAIIFMSSHPLVIHFDDIQWADNASLDILPSVADKISEHPVIIVCTYRSDEITREHRIRKLRSELRRIRKLNEINLNHLSFAESKLLTEAILKKSISPAAHEILFKHTQGIPLFIEEMVDSLIESGLLFMENGEYNIAKKRNLPVPENIKDAVLQKFSTLSAEAKALLEYASLLGLEFNPDYLSSLVSNSEAAFAELIEKNWLQQYDNAKALFKHTLIRETIKNEINWPAKKKKHEEIALFLETKNVPPVFIAEHWMGANESSNAGKWLLASLDQFYSVCAYADASETAKKIIDMCFDNYDTFGKIGVLNKYAYCTQLSGNFKEAEKTLKEIVELADQETNLKLLGETYRSLAVVYGLQGLGDFSILARIRSAEYFEKAGMYNESSAEYLVAASRCTGMVQFQKALEYSEKAAQVAELSNNINIESRAMALNGNVRSMRGDFSTGKKIVEDALSMALDNNDTDAASEIYRRLASTLEYGSDYNGARTAYVTAYNFCLSNGEDLNARVCLSCMSYILFQTGDWKKSLDICRDLIKNEHTPPTSLPVGYGMIGLINALRGETKTALKCLNEALTLSKRHNTTLSEILILWGLAVTNDLSGNAAEAENYYITMINRWKETQDVHDILPCLMWAAVFFKENNKYDELVNVIESITRINNITGTPEAMGALCFAIGESAAFQNSYSSALEQYKQALGHFEKLYVPLEQLIIEHRLSIAAIKIDEIVTAEKYLNRSYKTAKNLGTRPVASRIAQTMNSIGLRAEEARNPEAPSRAIKFGLTQRQSEILHLIKEGLTNKEIGNKLFLSNRTVDMHVSNILQRLNCRTRTEAISRIEELSD